MRKLLLLLTALICCTAGLALAGPNLGGTILMHYNSTAQNSDGNYSGYGGLTSCSSAVVTESVPNNCTTPGAWYAYAAFPTGSSPRVEVITLGVTYNPNLVFVCGTSFGATADGSTMVTYAADSHELYGDLVVRPPSVSTPFLPLASASCGGW